MNNSLISAIENCNYNYIGIRHLADANYYGTTVIIAGDRIEYGNDDHEIIIADAVVISIP